MQLQRMKLELVGDYPNREAALEAFRRGLEREEAVTLLTSLGYVHPDGEIRPCAEPPEGHVLWLTLNPILGESNIILGSDEVWLAVPENFQPPAEMSSPGEEELWSNGDYALLPEGTLLWREDQWVPFQMEFIRNDG